MPVQKLTKLFYSLHLIVKVKIVSSGSDETFRSISPFQLQGSHLVGVGFPLVVRRNRQEVCLPGCERGERKELVLDCKVLVFRHHWCCCLLLRVVGERFEKRVGVDSFAGSHLQSLFRSFALVTMFRIFSLLTSEFGEVLSAGHRDLSVSQVTAGPLAGQQ
jgi:hypothetical protein